MNIVSLTSHLITADLYNKRVFVRADLNVPLKNGQILNDYRLQALRPTLDLLRMKGAKIILATHIGRPVSYSADLSTSLLIPWFTHHSYLIDYEPNLATAYTKSFEQHSAILLLENMRFFPGEKEGSLAFAQQLAHLADYYVNDAFGLLHRSDTSITLTPTFFTPNNRTIGLLIEKELNMLNTLLEKPEKPFVLIIGGGKVADKLPVLESLLDSVTTILIGPAIVFTFLQAQGKAIGKSLVDPASLQRIDQLLTQARDKNVSIIFPLDYQIAMGNFNGPLSYCDGDHIPPEAVGVSIGPKTIKLFTDEIKKAKTVFYNGLMGTTQRPETLDGAMSIFNAMGQSNSFSVIGGGDSVAIAQEYGCADHIKYLSTGGGATLHYLAGKPLPGLQVFIDDTTAA